MSKLDAAIRFCGLFEAELLTELMLHHWKHPRAGDRDLANSLLEAAAEVLRSSQEGTRIFEDIPSEEMNFVAAVWYCESGHVENSNDADVVQRREWLERVRRALPGCFCDPDDLMP